MTRLAEEWIDVTNLADAFALRAIERPEAAAVTMNGVTISYVELLGMSRCVAAELQARGVERGDRVALVCDRSAGLIAAMIGTWQAGAAFVPIDPRYPEARIVETLTDAAPKVVIVNAVRQIEGASVVTLQEACVSTAANCAVADKGLDDVAYVIYTSGSTGKPKGVMVSQGNVLRLLTQTDAWFEFGRHDVWTMFHSPSFDFSVWEIWGSLLTGGRLIVVPHEVCRDPEQVCALIERYEVTVLNQSPSAFQLLMQAEARDPESVSSLRYVIFGGEALNLRSLLPWMDRHGDERPSLINMYGITETTVHVTYRRIRREDAERETASLIGVPIPDLSLLLLDEEMKPVDEGEMYIGGPGVALGYLNLPELTAERFLPNPFGEGRLYKSGDLARRRNDGELVYLGRGDNQVKVNGFRIELGEVESVLSGAEGVRQACVMLRQHEVAGASLVAYVVADRFDAKALAAHVSAMLPAHMRPAHFVQIERVPLTINGKVDRNALPAVVTASGKISVLSGTATEERVLRIWRETLAMPGLVDPTLNFFETGGTSLLLHQLRMSLERELSRPVNILSLFQFPTVRTFAAYVDADQAKDAKEVLTVKPRTAFRAIRRSGKVMHT